MSVARHSLEAMTDSTPKDSPLADLSQRRKTALEGLVETAQSTQGVIDKLQQGVTLRAAAGRGVVNLDSKGIGALSESLERIHKTAETVRLPELPKYEAPSYERIDAAAVLANLDAEALAVAQANERDRQEGIEREVAMLDALQGVQDGLTGIREVLLEQQEHATYNDRLQRAIFAVTVLGFIGAVALGVAAISGAWPVALIGGAIALALSAVVLWQTGLFGRSAN